MVRITIGIQDHYNGRWYIYYTPIELDFIQTYGNNSEDQVATTEVDEDKHKMVNFDGPLYQ